MYQAWVAQYIKGFARNLKSNFMRYLEKFMVIYLMGAKPYPTHQIIRFMTAKIGILNLLMYQVKIFLVSFAPKQLIYSIPGYSSFCSRSWSC